MSEAVAPPAWRQADAEALREALERAGGGGALPEAGFTDYVADLVRALEELLAELIGRAVPAIDRSLLEVLVWTITGGAAIAVVVVLVLALLRRRRRSTEAPAAAALAGPGEAPAAQGAAWWWEEAARRLERGEVRPALAALWWGAARRLDPPGLDPTWTTADLLRGAGAAASALPLRRLDRLLWGPGAPARADAEALRDELLERLA